MRSDMDQNLCSANDRRALLALWAVPGVGPQGLEDLARSRSPQGFEALLDLPTKDWAPGSLPWR
jgi:hypothetical protein